MKYKNLGTVKGHDNLKLIQLEDNRIIALDGWNGERWYNCYESDEWGHLNGQDNLKFEPVDEYNKELDQWETVGIEIYQ